MSAVEDSGGGQAFIATTYIDKSTWNDGPWKQEPDKVRFTTATGLAGLVVRAPSGALCGYVGVDTSHPLHGLDYNQSSPILTAALERRKEMPLGASPSLMVLFAAAFGGGDLEPRPDIVFTPHGGLTYSASCQEPTREQWEKWRQYMLGHRNDITEYPYGDMASAWAERADQVEDYESWGRWCRERAVCHTGGNEAIWWFGFDCSHCDDYCPAHDADTRGLGMESFSRGTYRDLSYVMAEVESLARQLTLLQPEMRT